MVDSAAVIRDDRSLQGTQADSVPVGETPLVDSAREAHRQVMESCVIYTRVSSVEAGRAPSTHRQERLTRAFVVARGWHVREVLTDTDRSAFMPRVRREGFEQLIERITRRQVDVVAVWRLDRLVRRPAEFERILLAMEQNNVALVSATEPVDTSTPIGLAIVRMLVTFSGLESTAKSERLRAKNRERAEAGLPHATIRPFGHTRDLSQIVETEAELIREAAGRVIGGESSFGIARDWAQRGVVGTRGRPFSGGGLGAMLRTARLTGDRSHNGQIVATDCFPAVLDRELAAELHQVLTLRRGYRSKTPSLLRGMVRCGSCGVAMYPAASSKGGSRRYTCWAGRWGCGRMSVREEHLDAWVTEQVLWRIGKRFPGNHRRLSPHGHETELLEVIRTQGERLRQLNRAYFIEAAVSFPEFTAARDELLEHAGVRIRAVGPGWPPPQVPPTIEPGDLPDLWHTLSKEAQRGVIASELATIIVNGTTRSGGWFDPARLEPRWHPDLPHIEPPPLAAPSRTPPRWRFRPAGTDGVPMVSALELRERHDLTAAQLNRLVRRGDLVPAYAHGRRYFPSNTAIDYPSTLCSRRQQHQPRADAGQLTLTGAVGYLGLNPSHLKRLFDHAGPPAVREGRRYWFNREDLDEWLESCRVMPLSLAASSAGQHRHRHDLQARFDALKGSRVTFMPSNDVWLSTQEAAKRLGVTPRTLYRFIDLDELPAYRMGRVIRLKAAEVDEFIEKSRIEPGTLAHLYPDTTTPK